MTDEIIAKIKNITGVDLIYFLDTGLNLVRKEEKNTSSKDYLPQILNILKLESLANTIGNVFYSKRFHTYTLLNETGLMVISKISNPELYIVIVAGESEPVDLLSLLKTCKEIRLDEQSTQSVI